MAATRAAATADDDGDYVEIVRPRKSKSPKGGRNKPTNGVPPRASKKRAPASKSPQRNSSNNSKNGGKKPPPPNNGAAVNKKRGTSPGRPNQGGRAPSPGRASNNNGGGPRKPITRGGGVNVRPLAPLPRNESSGHGGGQQPRRVGNNNNGRPSSEQQAARRAGSSGGATTTDEEDDEFDEGRISAAVVVRGDRSRVSTIRNHPRGSDHTHNSRDSRGRSNHSSSVGSRSLHSSSIGGGGGGGGADLGASTTTTMPSNHSNNGAYENSSTFGASFHEDDQATHSNEYPSGDDEAPSKSLSRYDESKLRPPPKIGMSNRDSDVGEFPNDKKWQKFLRYFRILKPHPQEDEVKRQVRILIWCTLILDVLVAVVSIATFGSGTTMCCGVAVMAPIPGINWHLFMQVISYIYLIGIFLEIYPVVREGPIPWNLLNPMFGFLISFAVFVDDSKAEALSIWILETGSVILEVITYRKVKMLHDRKLKRLEDLEDDIANEKYSHGYRKTAFLRERRELRLTVAESNTKLRYHLVGVVVNFVFVTITLIMIIFVARGGGLCRIGFVPEGVQKEKGLDIFNADQRSRCNECSGTDQCEICLDDGGINQCYYPYF